MCWVVLDRAVDLVAETGFEAHLDRWRRHREEIRTAILEEGLVYRYDGHDGLPGGE